MIANICMLYHGIGAPSRMTGSLYGGKASDSVSRSTGFGTVVRVDMPSFCEMKACPEFASWRVSYGTQSVEFCSRHTLSSMRNGRLWSRK